MKNQIKKIYILKKLTYKNFQVEKYLYQISYDRKNTIWKNF